MKEYLAIQKFLVMSPTKIRAVVGVVKKMTPMQALEILPYVGKKAATPLAKVIKAALANAKQAGAKEEELVFKEISVGEGPRLKRGRAASRGRWHPYQKKMSHIRVVLQVKERKAPEPKAVAKVEKAETKSKKVQEVKKGVKRVAKS